MKKAIIIYGPTASGKSALALQYALEHKGAIINIDASQLYEGIPIITASPTRQDRSLVPHYLYNHISPSQIYSVGQYLQEVQEVVTRVQIQGLLPIIVGGSGMYIKALIDGIHYIPLVSAECKAAVKELFDKLGKEKFYQLLLKNDPQIQEIISPNDGQRMQRAFAVLKQTGQSITSFYQQQPVKVLADFHFDLYYRQLPRETLYQRCNQRVEEFIKLGVLTEVKNLLPRWEVLTPSVQTTIGLRVFKQYLEQQLSYEETIDLVQQQTRQYVKKQTTWFRNQFDKHPVNMLTGK